MSTEHEGNQSGGPRRDRRRLSEQDREHLARLNKKFQVLRDRTAGTAKGYCTGLVVTGRGGTGKSWTIVEELERVGAAFKLSNSHLTPRALFDQLAEHPDAVHLIEDAEEVLRNHTSLSVLRSALWGSRHDRDGRSERLITWRTHKESVELVFGGGIIIVTNRRLSDLPEAKALATRVASLELSVNDQEIAALMRDVALRGYRRGDHVLDPPECIEVADYIIGESIRLNRALDMRMLINAFADRLQVEDHDAGCSWTDLVFSTICGRPSVLDDVEPVGVREQKRARELEIARELCGLPAQERLREWRRRTGKSRAEMYRREKELGRVDALDFET